MRDCSGGDHLPSAVRVAVVDDQHVNRLGEREDGADQPSDAAHLVAG